MQDPAHSHTSAKGRGHRAWLALGILVLGAIGVVAMHLQVELERNYKLWFTLAIGVLVLLLELIWFLFLSRFRWRTRLVTFGALILLSFALSKIVRVDGSIDGAGLPRLAWRWSQVPRKLTAAPIPVAVQALTPASDPRRVGLRDVPHFYGLNRDGVVRDAHLASDWTATPPKELWRQPIGAGWSAFAVVDGRAYTQEQRGEQELVTCYDALTGQLLWSHADTANFQQWQGGDGPRATPSIDRGQVFTVGATGILNCLDATTGKRAWTRNILIDHKLENLTWGVSASPLVHEETVVVTGGLTNGPTVMGYDRATGEPRWQSGTDKASYASPSVAMLAGRKVLLYSSAAALMALDPWTGEMLLRYPWAEDKQPRASQPVVLEGDRVFLSAGYGLGCLLVEVKAGADGKLTGREIWKSIRMKTQFNSVTARDGFVYGLDEGILACVDLAHGERKWKSGRYGSGQTLLVDDLLIIQSEPGAVVLAAANPAQFQELGRIPALSAQTWNHPTLAGRYLLLRNSEEAVCYELPLAAAGR